MKGYAMLKSENLDGLRKIVLHVDQWMPSVSH